MATTAAFLESECVGLTIDGRFPLLRWLGGTEQSSVFLTELEGDPAQKAAIKFTPANAVGAERRIAQWEAARAVSHPHLVRVFDCGHCEVDGVDLLYVVTEYADEVLSEILRERPLGAGETREMLGPVLEALAWLHGQNLAHGHLKPSNIMVVNERLKLSADRLQAPGEPGWASSSSGKYDAPEATFLTMSSAADMWSLGMVVVEALTQWPPRWDGRDDPFVPGTIPPPFSGIARECLRMDPSLRATLSRVRDVLQPARAAKPSAWIPAPRRSGVWAIVVSAMVVVGAIITALVVDSHHGPLLAAGPPDSSFSAPSETPSQPSVPEAEPSRTPPQPLVAKAEHSQTPPQPLLAKAEPSPAPPQPSAPEAAPSQTPPQPSAPEAAPSQTPPQPSASEAEPSQTPPQPSAPEAEPERGSVARGAVADQAIPDVPQHILDTVHGHIQVRVAVQVDADGKVAGATLDSPGPSQYFANRALAAARGWKFKPAERGGRAVASQWILQFRIGQDGTTATPTETSP